MSPKGAAWSSKLASKPPAERRMRISSVPSVSAVKSPPRPAVTPSAQRAGDVGDRLAHADGVRDGALLAVVVDAARAQVAPTTGAPGA